MAGQRDEEAAAEGAGGAGGDAVDRVRARSVAAAAAADFDPLRIRPYVSLPEPAGSSAECSGDEGGVAAGRPLTASPDAGRFTSYANPETDTKPDPGADPGADTKTEPAVDPHEDADPHETRRLRKRPLALLAVTGAVAAVTAATVFAVGLLSSASDGPTRDRTLPDDLTSAYADPTKPAAPSAHTSASSSRALSAPASARPSRSASPTRSALPPSPRPSSGPPSTARATGSVDTSASPPRGTAGATLRQGDKGAQVTELQGRLVQLYLYVGEVDGSYTYEVTAAVRRYQWARGLRDDAPGEYGRETRRSLESETTKP
ncbi:peptidoglycan-binding domain-containing protein [Streptomyces venezuelae]|uniref:peptidoglycan-binding domain-containing protein n=1 Tax=Streptomyces venezuelae TaxID=54571 RepID=UPI003453E130